MGLKYSIDGNQVCATDVHFKSLATCPAGFGDSLKEAFVDYYKSTKKLPIFRDCHSWELDWAFELGPAMALEEVESLHAESKL